MYIYTRFQINTNIYTIFLYALSDKQVVGPIFKGKSNICCPNSNYIQNFSFDVKDTCTVHHCIFFLP